MGAVIDWVNRLLGRKKPVVIDKENLQAVMFAQLACHYYATARFAMYARRDLVCGVLFHDAIEMALKGGLARKRGLGELSYLGHNLKALWRAFKQDFPNSDLDKHTKTISTLNKAEEIRYPGTEGSIAIHLEWSGVPAPTETFGGFGTPKQYPLAVTDIDELFAYIFWAASWNPIHFMNLGNPAASEAIRLFNNQSEYLTGQPKLTSNPALPRS